jgi:hypothetical protein
VATDDLQRLVTGIAPAPAIFTVPGNGQIRPKSIFAAFDGTGAGSAFFPTLKVISDAGKTVGIYSSDTSVAAGASADVSWFPRLAAKAAAAPAGSGWTFAAMSAPAIVTVNAGTSKIVDMDPAVMYTNAPSVFAIGSKVIGGTTFHGMKVIADGHYLAKGQGIVGGLSAANTGFVGALWFDFPGAGASYGSGGVFVNCPIAVAQGQWDPYIENLVTVSGGSSDIWLMQVHNTTAVNVTAYLDMVAVQLDTDTTRIF